MEWEGDALHMRNNTAHDLFCGGGKATRFLRATIVGTCAKPERRRPSREDTRVGTIEAICKD